ncbi:MAG: hypothetical protein ACD_8C00039G0001 [uncultured bacterium]|nr:MAG: hypothetical protein ACD_8C00039G0001 [uncultured bacterium]
MINLVQISISEAEVADKALAGLIFQDFNKASADKISVKVLRIFSQTSLVEEVLKVPEELVVTFKLTPKSVLKKWFLGQVAILICFEMLRVILAMDPVESLVQKSKHVRLAKVLVK